MDLLNDNFNFNKKQYVPYVVLSKQGNIDLVEERGIIVQVFAGLDIVKKSIVWEFQTIDPLTGKILSLNYLSL